MSETGNGLAARLAIAKLAYTTRVVPAAAMRSLRTGDGSSPRAGDLVLARVLELGQHPRLELREGRRSRLFVGDEIAVCFGNRYAPDQFEAEIPPELGPCDLVAAGGVASRMLSRHSSMSEPTTIEPVGYVCDADGRRVNLAGWGLPARGLPPRRPPVIAVLGTAMNAGKTTAAASLIRGLAVSGQEVAAAKVTGTGAGGDIWHMTDAGARVVLDFVDTGFPSTYRLEAPEVERIFTTLIWELTESAPDTIVVEVADGVFQRETEMLLRSPVFRAGVDAVLFAGCDALGAVAGVGVLRELGLPVAAVSGALTGSPLAAHEAAAAGLPVLGISELLRAGELELLGLRVPRVTAAVAQLAA